MKFIERILGAWMFAVLVPFISFLTKANLSPAETVILAVGALMAVTPLLFFALGIKNIAPIAKDAKSYWQTMPEKDRVELQRILGQAAEILLRKAAQDGNFAAKTFRWIFKMSS